MGSLKTSQSNLESNISSQNTLQSKTAPIATYRTGTLQISNPNVFSYEQGNKSNDFRPSSGASRAVSQLCVANVCDLKIKRKGSYNFQPPSLKQIHETQTISIVQSFSNAQVSSSQRLDGKARSESSLLSRTYKKQPPKVSTHKLSGTTTPDDVPTLRDGSVAHNVCLDHQLVSKRSQGQVQYADYSVLGRLPDRKSISQPFNPSCSSDSNLPVQSRLDREPGQKCDQTYSSDRIPGHSVGHGKQLKVTTWGKSKENPSVSPKASRNRQLVPQAGAMPLRVSQLCGLHHPPGKAALSCDATLLQPTAYPSSTLYTRGKRRASLVAKEYITEHKHTPSNHRGELHNYGRVRHEMGSSHKQRKGARRLGRSPEKVALQPKGNVCSDISDPSSGSVDQELYDHSTDRQPHRSKLHKKRRRHQVTSTATTDHNTTDTDRRTKHGTAPALSTGKVQHGGRQPITQSRRLRMAPHERSLLSNIRNVGSARNRPLRFKNRSRRSKICLSRLVRLERLLSRRLFETLALPVGVGVPTPQPHAASASSHEHCDGHIHSDRARVDQTILETRPESTISNSTVENTPTPQRVEGHEDQPPAGTSTGHSSTSLASLGWDSLTQDWSPEEQNLLSSCWRESTFKTYIPIWNKWSQWCLQTNIDCKNPAPQSVARYLAYLNLKQNLAYRSILVHKSVISSIVETLTCVKISNSPIVKHMLKALSQAKPPPNKPPIWDARIVIKYLRDSNPNIDNLYEVSQRTAALLLLISGRRVHDLTLLRCTPDRFILGTDRITMIPVFGSKTDTSSYQQSNWTLLAATERNIDPVFWLKQLLKVTEDIRGSVTNLFITIRNPIKPASPTIIGGWLKRLLTDSGVHSSPGSFRSAVSSLNWIENYPINDILSKANWKNENTFRNHYQREISQSSQTLNERSLSNLFIVD